MLLTFIMLPFVIKIFVLPIFEWPLKTGFTLIIIGINGSLQPVLYMHSIHPHQVECWKLFISCHCAGQ